MTKIGAASHTRYNEGCIAAHALDLIGDRWALLVSRELLLGPKRFGTLRAGLPGLSANILTRRLADLEAAGLLIRKTLPPPVSIQLYELTPGGMALRPVLESLCRWGAEQPGHDPRRFISPTSLMLSMAAMIDRRAATELRISVGMNLGAEAFAARLAGGCLLVSPDTDPAGDLTFTGSPNAVAIVIYGPMTLAQSLGRTLPGGAVAFSGDPALGQAFVDLFSLSREPAEPDGSRGTAA